MNYETGYNDGAALARTGKACPRKGETEYEAGRFDGWHDTVQTLNEEMLESEEQDRDYQENHLAYQD